MGCLPPSSPNRHGHWVSKHLNGTERQIWIGTWVGSSINAMRIFDTMGSKMRVLSWKSPFVVLYLFIFRRDFGVEASKAKIHRANASFLAKQLRDDALCFQLIGGVDRGLVPVCPNFRWVVARRDFRALDSA